MRLLNIKATNFGSYRDADISLEHLHAVCVTGNNGAGKSTLFMDAVRWCLFGKARASTDAMLRLGAQDMSIVLRFSLENQIYRVIRKRSLKTKVGKTELTFQMESDGTLKDISGARLNDTQIKIETLLHSDDALLTSTAFLIQGQADRFSTASPTERKQILSAVLRLEQWNLLREAARRSASRIQIEEEQLHINLNHLQEGLDNLEDLEAQQIEIVRSQQELEAELRDHTAELDAARMSKACKSAQLNQLIDQSEQFVTKQQTITRLESLLGTINDRRNRIEKILANRDKIEDQVREASKCETRLMDLDEEETKLMHSIAGLTELLDHDREREREIVTLQSELREVRRHGHDLEQAYRRETQGLQEQVDRNQRAITLLDHVPCDAGLQARCQFTIDAVTVQTQQPTLKTQLSERLTMTEHIMEAIRPDYASSVHGLESQIQLKTEARSAQNIEGIAQVRMNEQRNLEELRAYRLQLREALRGTAQFTCLVPELQRATEDLVAVTADAATTEEQLRQTQEEVQTCRNAAMERLRINDQLEEIERQMTLLQTTIETAMKHLMTAKTDHATLIARVQTLKDKQAQIVDLGTKILALQERHSDFEILVDAYRQIPILIMETSLPLLERFANGFLAKVSSTGMQIRIDTQKALKSRDGLAETLDIIVRDLDGERAYELYSGGERFRLDLALRIALSQLLAHRAQSKLETLVIDEGFGALDATGLQRLGECLPALQETFPLFIIITHVEQLHHTLPSQIVIEKTEAGSNARLLT